MNQITSEKIPCSVGILTLNCADNLRHCLESLKDFAEVIVFDGNSTDDTLKVAKEYGCRIAKQFVTDEPNQTIKDFAEVRNRLLDLCSYDWYLSMDSDESASKELVEEVREIIKNPKGIYIYYVSSKFVLNNKVIQYSSGYPGYEIYFLNRKTGVRYDKSVHEVIRVDEKKHKVGYLKGPRLCLLFEVDTDFKLWKEKIGKYIEMEVNRTKNVHFFDFFKWQVLKQLVMIVKALIKITLIYLRHGFKETLPLRIEFQRIYFYVWLLLANITNYFKITFKKSDGRN